MARDLTVARMTVRLTPRAGRAGIDGWSKQADGRDVLVARVTAAPVDGAANDALVRMLARALRIAPGRVAIVGGATARTKTVELEEVTDEEISAAFGDPSSA